MGAISARFTVPALVARQQQLQGVPLFNAKIRTTLRLAKRGLSAPFLLLKFGSPIFL